MVCLRMKLRGGGRRARRDCHVLAQVPASRLTPHAGPPPQPRAAGGAGQGQGAGGGAGVAAERAPVRGRWAAGLQQRCSRAGGRCTPSAGGWLARPGCILLRASGSRRAPSPTHAPQLAQAGGVRPLRLRNGAQGAGPAAPPDCQDGGGGRAGPADPGGGAGTVGTHPGGSLAGVVLRQNGQLGGAPPTASKPNRQPRARTAAPAALVACLPFVAACLQAPYRHPAPAGARAPVPGAQVDPGAPARARGRGAAEPVPGG